MAQVNIFKAFVLAVIFAAIAVSAQVPEMSPAPSPNAGAGFSLPVSGAVIGMSLLISLVAPLAIRNGRVTCSA